MIVVCFQLDFIPAALTWKEKSPLRASAGSATSNLSPANYNTDLGREGGGSVITHNSMTSTSTRTGTGTSSRTSGRNSELSESYLFTHAEPKGWRSA